MLLFPSFLPAQDTDPTVVSSDLKDESRESLEKIDNEDYGVSPVGSLNKFVSQGVLGAADKVDRFFGDNRSITDTNKTRIRLRLDLDFEQNEGTDLSPNVFANISLPNTKNRLRLFVNGDEGDNDVLETDINNNEDNGSLFLRYYFIDSPFGSLATDTGLRFRSIGVEWFGGLRARTYQAIGPWGFRLTNKFRWFTERKFTNETRLDTERVIADGRTFFRSTTEGRWFQQQQGYFIEQRFTIFHKINEKTGIAPEWITLGETDLDSFFKETRLRLRIRRNVGWKWLYVEVGPGLVWKEEYDYDTNYAVRLRFDVYFGNLGKIKLF